jgi:hypothetical protein
MKSLLILIPFLALSVFMLPSQSHTSTTKQSINNNIDSIISETVAKQKIKLDEQETSLHNSLDNFRDTVFITNVKTITDTLYVRQIEEMRTYIEKPTFYKIVHSIYTPRGYHEKVDTFKINN